MHWKVIQSVLTGTSHIKSNTPCQDSIAFYSDKDRCTIVLADGAGSASLSEIGSCLACKTIVKLMGKKFEIFFKMDASAAKLKIIHAIRTSIGIIASKKQKTKQELASTLLFVSIKGEDLIIGHIGDGVIGGIHTDGTMELLSEPENGEFANTTFFTTSENYKVHLRIKKGTAKNYRAFFLMSDGAAECLFHKKEKSFAPAIIAVSSWVNQYDIDDINKALYDNMKNMFPMRTTDDCSFIMCQKI